MFLTFLLFGILFSSTASAVNWDFDLFGSFGKGSAIVSSQSSSKPESVQMLGGLAVGVSPFRIFSVGAISDYRKVSQKTEAVAPWGNRTGTRWNKAAPYADVTIGRLRARYVHQMLGAYELENQTSAGKSVKYDDVSGFRLELHGCVLRGKERYYKIPGKCLFYMGGFYEKLEFGTEKVGTSPSATLASPLMLKHFGAVFGFGF